MQYLRGPLFASFASFYLFLLLDLCFTKLLKQTLCNFVTRVMKFGRKPMLEGKKHRWRHNNQIYGKKQTGLLVFLYKKELWFSWLANNFLWTKNQNSTAVRNHLYWHVSSKIFLFRESLIPYNLTCMLPLRPTLFSLRLRWVIKYLVLTTRTRVNFYTIHQGALLALGM